MKDFEEMDVGKIKEQEREMGTTIKKQIELIDEYKKTLTSV